MVISRTGDVSDAPSAFYRRRKVFAVIGTLKQEANLMIFTLLPVAVALATVAAGANAQPAQRYEIVAVSDGIVRLDIVTGAMTHCRDAADGFACTAIAGAQGEAVPGRLETPPADSGDTLQDFDQALGMMEKAMKSFMDITGQADRSCSL
jgi:hypothetical protein